MSLNRGLNRGLKYDDDDGPSDPQQYGKTGFQANRQRTTFEQDVDSLLFGKTKPPPRRQRGDPNQKPAQQTPTKLEAKQLTSSSIPTPIKATINQKPTKPQPTPSKLYDRPTLKQPQKSKKQDSLKQINKQSEGPKIGSQPTPTPKPKPIQNKPVIQPKPKVQPQDQMPQPQIIAQQPKNVKQQDAADLTFNIDNKTLFNRPAYIRKLKKVAQDFNFAKQNTDKHRFIEVIRPSQCLRNTVKKLNSPGYQDHEFPPNWTSIGKDARNENIQWKTPEQAFKTPVFGKYVDPNDILPGTLSSPQFLSTLSCLAERQQNIKRLIQNQKNNANGFYYVRLNINGVWRYIAVDHNLPQINGQPLGARSFSDSQSQLWISIVQKAYAKAYHSYSCFKSTIPRQHYLRDLTGYPVRKIFPTDQQFSQTLNQVIGFGWPLVAVPSQKIVDLGFNPNYSLSVIKQTVKGFQFRNSWGTIVQRSKINISRQGAFQLALTQIKDYISYIAYAEVDPTLSSTTIQSKHHESFYSCYSFKINNQNPNATISISQFDRRLFSEALNYDYVPFRVILEKKDVADDQNHSLFVNAGFSHNSRNLELAVNLTPGKYYLYCVGSWGEKHYDYNVSFYANQLVNITKINHAHFPNLISQTLTKQCLTYGKKTSKGNVDEYILYHQPSNLALITVLSLVDKAFNHTINLQQVNSDSLSLLNVVKPEDNFAKKFRHDNKNYKQSVFNKKSWQVNLLPHEKYTWVFSTNQDFSHNNLKNWGFK